MASTLIMPCAGKSTRFNLSRPKWMLTHPSGNLMLMESIYGLNTLNVSNIIIAVVQEHIEKSKINLDKIKDIIQEKKLVNVHFHILKNFTSSQSETVYKVIKEQNITGSIFIKDCDNFFEHNVNDKNEICVGELQQHTNAINKSYVYLDRYDYVSGIVEKQVIGNKFCAGGYSFENCEDFVSAYEAIVNLNHINTNEIYVSNIVQKLLLDDKKFGISYVSNYQDWGTLEEWQKYIGKFKTLFVDIDGVICQNSSEFFQPEWGQSEALINNVKLLTKLFDSGFVTIVLTTSRKNIYQDATKKQLSRFGIKYHNIIFDLPHATRIIINDYSQTNPYPSAVAINLNRNSDMLYELLGEL